MIFYLLTDSWPLILCSVGVSLKELGRSDVEMFQILHLPPPSGISNTDLVDSYPDWCLYRSVAVELCVKYSVLSSKH